MGGGLQLISCGLKEHLVTPAHGHLPPAPPALFRGVALDSRVGGSWHPLRKWLWGDTALGSRAQCTQGVVAPSPHRCHPSRLCPGAAPEVPSWTCRSGSSMLGDAALPAVTSRGVSPSFLPQPRPPLLTQTLQLGTATAVDGT